MSKFLKILCALVTACLILPLSGCGEQVKLNPKNPVTITVWHYYNGAILSLFDDLVAEFNETVGSEKGIIVEASSMGSVAELERAVSASAAKEVGSLPLPNIFATYADTAYSLEELGLLADLGEHFSAKEQAEYIDSFIEEGRIGFDGELRIFPIAKSTEIFLLNETDWLPFAEEAGVTYDDLSTLEGLTRVAALYYDWTDAKTPDILHDGKAFFGRDYIANLMTVSAKQFGVELIKVQNGEATIQVDRDTMRKVWDNYYVPYISGHFYSYGRYSSDDARVGDIICYIGSNASASYFPTEITKEGSTYPITAKVLPVPAYAGAQNVLIQQGAGMAMTASTPIAEYAGMEFLKWFTEAENNTYFAAMSAYLPVKKDAMDYSSLTERMQQNNVELNPLTDETLRIVMEQIKVSELYTSKAFSGGAEVRSILDGSLQELCVTDRENVINLLESGSYTVAEAVAEYNTSEHFDAWVSALEAALVSASGG